MMTAEIEKIIIRQGNKRRVSGYRISTHSDRKTDSFESSGFKAVKNTRKFSFDRLKEKTPERIPLFGHRGEMIYARVGDIFKIGKGEYQILHYDPTRRWRHPHGIEPTVVCELVSGNIHPDFKDAATRWNDNKITINLCVKTLSQYYRTDYKHENVKPSYRQLRLIGAV